jgi:hypothetical protein
MNMSAPRQITLTISVVIALVALVARYAGVPIPFISEHTFGTLLFAYLVLVIGNVLEGV